MIWRFLATCCPFEAKTFIPYALELPERHSEERFNDDMSGWNHWGGLVPAMTGAMTPGPDSSVAQPLDVVKRQPRRNREFRKAAIPANMDRHFLGERWSPRVAQPKLQRTTVHRYLGIRPARSTRHF
jgi:hypothetical protein